MRAVLSNPLHPECGQATVTFPTPKEEYDHCVEQLEALGKQHVQKEGGQFSECGYVAYHGTMTLEELMAGDPAEQHQREQGFQMGGPA